MPQKFFTVAVYNQTLIDCDVVLFNALRNPTIFYNSDNTMQQPPQNAIPIHSITGINKLLSTMQNNRSLENKGLCYNVLNDALIFEIEPSGELSINGFNGFKYLHFLEFLKTQAIKISKVRIETNLPVIGQQNWRIKKYFEDGNTSEQLLNNTQVTTPQTVAPNIAFFNVDKVIDKFTGVIIQIKSTELKQFTFYYS